MSLLADDILIDGVGRGEPEDESSKCNHDNTEDHHPMPAVTERSTLQKTPIEDTDSLKSALNIFYIDTESNVSNVKESLINKTQLCRSVC